MSFTMMLPWFVGFLVMLVVLMFLIRHLLRTKELGGATPVKDRANKS